MVEYSQFRADNMSYDKFICPVCGTGDVFFVSMPERCYACLSDYNFNVDLLSKSRSRRIEYYKNA